jgi:hypothetical protein
MAARKTAGARKKIAKRATKASTAKKKVASKKTPKKKAVASRLKMRPSRAFASLASGDGGGDDNGGSGDTPI